MNGLTGIQREVALLLFSLPESQDFALAGGSALVALGVIDRPTRDLDAFAAAQAGEHVGDVGPLAAALRAEMERIGWNIEAARQHQTFTRLIGQKDRESIEIDLAIDSPPAFPLERAGTIPCLAPQDLAARKVLAMLDRSEGRDFTDLWTLSRQHGKADVISWARQLDTGVDEEQIARAFVRLERLHDDELPCDEADRLSVRQWFQRWRSELDVSPTH
ncbi:MAG: nucleotidyl transferase AbiEii/AbiGii toxin family protein [Microthrixaceae bacterium]